MVLINSVFRLEINERPGKSVVTRTVKRPKRLKDAFSDCEKVEKTFWFCHCSIYFKDDAFTAVKREAKF